MHVRRLEQNWPYRYYENRDEIGLLSKVLWEYWFGWDRAGSETNPDQSPQRDHQSVACIGGNPYTQEQRMFVTGNIPNVVMLVCPIVACELFQIQALLPWWPHIKVILLTLARILVFELARSNFLATKGNKPSNRAYILKYLNFVVVLQSNQSNIAASVWLNFHWERLCHQHHPQTMTVQKHQIFKLFLQSSPGQSSSPLSSE